MSKELTKKEPSEVAIDQELDAWGQQEVSQEDIIIPKVLVMQGLSDLVTEGKANMGEFRSSLTGELLGSIEKPMEFVPVHMVKSWIIFKMNDKNQYEFSTIVPMTKENENWEWEAVDEDGRPIRRDRTLNFYILRVEDLKDGAPIPYVISFRRTSARAGKKLATQMFVINAQAKKNPAAKVMKLTGRREKNDQGTYIVTDLEVGRDSTRDEQMAGLDLLRSIKTSATKVDNSDIDGGDF